MRGYPRSWMVIWCCGSPWPSILHLAQKYEGPMHCVPEVLDLAAQWSFWVVLEMEAQLL
jgi:hypothetical protein